LRAAALAAWKDQRKAAWMAASKVLSTAVVMAVRWVALLAGEKAAVRVDNWVVLLVVGWADQKVVRSAAQTAGARVDTRVDYSAVN